MVQRSGRGRVHRHRANLSNLLSKKYPFRWRKFSISLSYYYYYSVQNWNIYSSVTQYAMPASGIKKRFTSNHFLCTYKLKTHAGYENEKYNMIIIPQEAISPSVVRYVMGDIISIGYSIWLCVNACVNREDPAKQYVSNDWR